MGSPAGAFDFIGNLSSISVPIVIGYLVRDGDFAPALVFIGALGAVGLFSYIFFVGKLERIEIAETHVAPTR